MGDIYHNSFITIAASASSESRAGFLSTRKDHISKDFSVSHPIFPKGLARFKVRVALGKHKRHDIPAKIRDPWRTNLISGKAGISTSLVLLFKGDRMGLSAVLRL